MVKVGAVNLMFRSTLTEFLWGQYTQWACGLSGSYPTQCASMPRTSSLDPVAEWTQMICPHLGTPERSGLLPVSFSKGVVAFPKAWVEVRFLSQTAKWIASA
jgi:hypothetical protein